MARIKQIHVAGGLIHFKPDFMRRWAGREYSNPDAPAIFFGMYGQQEKELLRRHRGLARIVWGGSDAMRIDSKLMEVIRRPNVEHVAIGHFIGADLAALGLKFKLVPLTGVLPNPDPCPRGEKIYWYHGGKPDFYGGKLVEEIRRRVPYEFVEARHTTFARKVLYEKYRECFIALRLTPHDGLPVTVLEMGMLGRRSIYNGMVPHSIPWLNVDDIVENIHKEYERRGEANGHIANDIARYIDVGPEWMDY